MLDCICIVNESVLLQSYRTVVSSVFALVIASIAIVGAMAHKSKSRFGHLPLSARGPLECSLKGTVLLSHPYFNKGSAFTKEERRDFELSGLLPQAIQTLEQQVNRAYEQYSSRHDDLAKNTFLTSMKEQNEVLYFKVGLSAL